MRFNTENEAISECSGGKAGILLVISKIAKRRNRAELIKRNKWEVPSLMIDFRAGDDYWEERVNN